MKKQFWKMEKMKDSKTIYEYVRTEDFFFLEKQSFSGDKLIFKERRRYDINQEEYP